MTLDRLGFAASLLITCTLCTALAVRKPQVITPGKRLPATLEPATRSL